jgi:hypothetical protein
MRYLHQRTPLLASTVLFWSAVAFYPIPGTAAEQSPAWQGVVQPVTPPAVSDKKEAAQAPAGPPQTTASPRPAAASPAQHAAELAAAATGPAPTGATIVPLPARSTATAPLTITASFLGLNRQTAANNGFIFIPPDTILGKSPSQVLEATNSALRLFDTFGRVLATADLNTFFGAPLADTRLFDPKVYYDRNAFQPRTYVVGLQKSSTVSRIWLAISRTPDPVNLTSNWCRYNIDARGEVGTANVSWGDFPALGTGLESLSIAVNNFRFSDTAFRFSRIHVFNKLVASNNGAACPSIPHFIFQPASTPGNFSFFTLQPVQHYSSPSSGAGVTNPAYYLSTVRGTSNLYLVHRIKNVASGAPTYTFATLTSNITYGIPPASPEPGTTLLIDSGDNRVLQVAGIGDTLVGQLTTVCNFTAGTPNESCALTPRVSVFIGSSGQLLASLPENTFSGLGNNIFVHHPGIATNFALQSATTWEFNGTTIPLSSAALIKNVNAGWGFVQTYAPGTCTDLLVDNGQVRSGDYTGAQLDPSGVGFWLAGEQAIPIPAGSTCQWQTRVIRLNP